MSLVNFFKSIFGRGAQSAKGSSSDVSRKAPRQARQKPEKEIGIVTHYYGNISVGIIKLKSTLHVGDRIHIKGVHDDFSQKVESMQLNHKDIPEASAGSEIGIKTVRPAHENDKVYAAAE